MLTPLQLPRSWFRVTKHSCTRRHNNSNNAEEEEESYFQIKGRIFTAPQAIWFHSNFADRHCIPLLLSTQLEASSLLPVCSDEEFDEINQQIGIVESTGTLTQLPCEDKVEQLSTRKGSFYIAHNQPMLCVQLGNGGGDALTYFGLSDVEYTTLVGLNETSVLKDAFFLQVALALLDKQSVAQSAALHALMTTNAGQASASDANKRSNLLPADNEVFHFGLLRKHNKKFGLSAKHVLLALGRIVLVSTAEASSAHASIKALDLFRARCRCTGEKSFECQFAGATSSSILFTCEDKTERDMWMHKIQVCALFSVNQPTRNNSATLLLPQCTSVPQVMRFEPQTILVEDLLECLGRGRGEVDANMRQSTLDFERDRVIINAREVIPCLVSNLILELVKELNSNGGTVGVDEETKMEFVRMILLAATRTQCGGLIYECLQQVFRSTEELQDRLMISPRSEQVPAIELTVSKATPDLPHTTTTPSRDHMAALQRSLEALHLHPAASPLDSTASTPATTFSPATATLPPATSQKSSAADLLPTSMKRTHRRSASDPQFFKKMLQKQTSSSTSTTTPPTAPQAAVQTPPVMVVPESPRGGGTTPSYHHPFASRLPPPPASASAYFKHNRTFSLQKKNHLDVEFHHLDSVPQGAICVNMHAEMDFVIRDCETNEKLTLVRAKYSRSFYLIEHRSLAKDQGQISLEMLALEDKDVAPPPVQEEANMRSMVTDVTDEDYRSVVFLSEDEGGSFTRRSQFEEEEEEVRPYVM